MCEQPLIYLQALQASQFHTWGGEQAHKGYTPFMLIHTSVEAGTPAGVVNGLPAGGRFIDNNIDKQQE